MSNNLNVQVTAGLNVTKSVAQINADIQKINGQLKQLRLTAQLDENKSNAKIKKQIDELNNQRKQLYVDLKLRQKDLKKQFKQIQEQSKFTIEADTVQAQKQISDVGKSMQNASTEAVTLGTALKSALSNAGLVLSAQTALHLVRNAASEATEAVKEYDKYQTNLSVITGKSRSESDDIIADLADKSFEYKVDISELESATETLLRTGKSMEEIEHYLKDTVYLSKIGFGEATESAESLVTIGNAFEFEAEQMESVVDKLLVLDTASNTVASKLASALQTTAQNAKLAGMNIDQLGATVAALKDISGRSESEISTALNSITSRVYNVKLGKYELELEDGTTEDITQELNNVERMLSNVGISVRDSKDNFRDLYDIINDIVPKWSEFSNVDRNSIGFVFGGTRHKNTFINIIESWERINELIKLSAESSGQAEAKYSTYIDSIEAKSSALSTSMKELWNGLVANEFVGNLTDATTGVIKFADEYRVLQNLLKSVTFYAFAKGLVSTKNSLLGIVTDVKNVSTAFVQLETVQKSTRGTEIYKSNIKALGTTVSALSDKQIKLLLSTNQLSNSQKVAVLHASGLSKKEAELKLQTLGLATTQKTATASTVSLSGSLKALWATISANPIMAVTMLFSGITMAISAYKQKVEEAREQAVESAEECNEQIKALQNLRTEYINIVDSESTVSEKTEGLNRWKQTLIETYGFEKEAIEQVNTAREDGLELLDKEILKNQINAAETWLTDNKDAYEEAKSVLTTQDTSRQRVKNTVMNIAKDELDDYSENFDDIIKQLSIKNPIKDNPLAQINLIGGTTLRQYENLKNILNDITSIKVSKGLNEAEEELYDALLKKQEEYKKVVTDDMIEIFENGKKYTEMLQVYNFETTEGINFENVTQDNYKKFRDEFLTSLGFGLKKDSTDFSLDIEQTLLEMLPDLERAYRGIEDIAVESAEANEETAKSIEDLQKAYDGFSKSASEFIKSQKTFNSVLEEQKEHGQLSASTIQELTEAGYAQALAIDAETGAVTLNVAEYNRLNELKRETIRLEAEQQKSELVTKLQEEKKAIEELGKEYADANAERKKAIMLEMEERGSNYNDIQTRISNINAQLAGLNAPTFDDGKSSSSDPNKEAFEREYRRREHWTTMGVDDSGKEYTEQMLVDWLDSAEGYKLYFSDLTKYQEEYWQYEEEVYNKRKQFAQDYFDTQKELMDENISALEEKIATLSNESVDSDGNFLNPKEKFSEIRSTYTEILTHIDNLINEIVQSGVEGHEDMLAELEKQREEYSKTLDDVFKDEINNEIEYLEWLQEEQTKVYDERIDALEKEKSAIEERYDAEIKKLQDKNDEEKRTNDLIKARQDLEKAKRNKRLVFDSNGNMTYTADTEAVNEAEQSLKDVETEIKIEELEKQKEAATATIDDEIEVLKEQKAAQESYYSALLNILDAYLNPKSTQSIESVWEKILSDPNVTVKDGSIDVKGQKVDTTAVSDGKVTAGTVSKELNYGKIVKGDEVAFKFLKQLGMADNMVNQILNGQMSYNSAISQTGSKNLNSVEQYTNPKRDLTPVNTTDGGMHLTIGDININEPVGDSVDLATAIIREFPNAITRQIYKNRR